MSWPCFIQHGDELVSLAPARACRFPRSGSRRIGAASKTWSIWCSGRVYHEEPRWAVGSQVRATLKLVGTRQATGTTDAEDAGRIDYTRLHARDIWALRVCNRRRLVEGASSFPEQARRFPNPAARFCACAAGLCRRVIALPNPPFPSFPPVALSVAPGGLVRRNPQAGNEGKTDERCPTLS